SSLSALCFSARIALGQAGSEVHSVQLNCDDDAYPTVTCAAVVTSDKTDVPLRGIDQDRVVVRLANRQDTFEALSWQEVTDERLPVTLVLVVDFSSSLGQTAAEVVRRGIDAFMRDMAVSDSQVPEAQRDLVGIVAVVGPIEIGNDPRNLPLSENREHLPTTDRNLIRNTMRLITLGRATPLYDAVYKAILIANQAQTPRRAVVIISDGRDQGTSRVFKAEDTLTRALSSRVPLFTIAVGPSRAEEYLKRAAFETDAIFQRASDSEQLIQALSEVRRLLKTRYNLSLQAKLPPDGAQHPLEVQIGSGSAVQARGVATIVTRPPIRPEILSIAVLDNAGQPIDLTRPLPKPSVRLEVQIRARAVSRVEFEVNDSGNVLTVRQPPFAVDLDTQNLSGEQTHKLTIRAYGVPDTTENRDQKEFTFAVASDVSVQALPQLPGFQPNRLSGVVPWLIVAGLALLVAVAVVAVSVVSRRRVQDATLADLASMPAPVSSHSPSPPSLLSSERTQILTGPPIGESADRTIVLQPGKYRLEILGGEMRGRVFPIGVQGAERVRVGREPDGSPTFIRLSSPHVSRKHAEFVLENDKVFLVDLGSSSGTFHNGRRLQTSERVEVRPGDRILFADVEAEVKL
ncbi:MAG: FHA domain-containing protein, partial [Thermoflexales bacterium]|nr:FHA domain-containing protein [Thermoflexales bacterium]